MPARSHAAAERAALCELLDAVGPSAPTLCDGWSTHDLAAHLFVRERRPHAAIGLLVTPLSGVTERATRRAAAMSYDRLVDRLRHGPPLPLRPADRVMNLHEFFVHHEDVRRAPAAADWSPRDDAGLDRALWALLRRSAGFLTRRLKSTGVGLELAAPGEAEPIRARRGEPVASLAGRPQEIVLYLFGRKDVADVELRGPDDAVEALRAADLSA